MAGATLFGGDAMAQGIESLSENRLGQSLAGGFEGAATGAMIGSIIPGVGTAAGAVIGGVIGGVAPFIDKGTKEGAIKLLSGISNSMRNVGTGLLTSVTNSANSIASALASVPKMLGDVVTNWFKSLPERLRGGVSGAVGVWGSITSFFSRIPVPSLPFFYAGRDFYGPALGLEARMSGRRPMVVNDGEFVIPNNGFSTLAGLVGDNLRRTGVLQDQSNQGVNLNVTLELNVNSVVADPQQLADALRDPVLQIISDAWREANITTVRRPRVS